MPSETASSGQRWRARTVVDSAAALHARPFPDHRTPELWRLLPTAPAIALGSRQTPDVVRPDGRGRATFEIAARRSGGGAVVVDPAATLWVDVFIPRHGPLWDDDLGRTFLAVGERWQHTIARLGLDTELWTARPDASTEQLGRLACFAGVGWGELLVDGQKIVGLSQRRTRWGARVQCLYDPAGSQRALVEALEVSPRERSRLAEIFLPTMSEMPSIDAVWAALATEFGIDDA